MQTMTRKNEPKTAKRVRKGTNVNVWIDGPLADAFARYLETTRPRPTTTAAVELAIEMLVRSAGIEIKPDAE